MRALNVFLAERIHRSHHFLDPIFGFRDSYCDSLPILLLDTTKNSLSARGEFIGRRKYLLGGVVWHSMTTCEDWKQQRVTSGQVRT